MRHFKTLLKESKNLEVFEVIRLLNEFISDKGVKASVQKFDNCFDIYISGYADDEAKKELSESGLLKYFKSLGVSEEAGVVKTKYGYKIVMGSDANDAKLMEAYAKEDTELFECCICEDIHHGVGKNPWPISDDLDDRVCESCNKAYVVPTRLEQLTESRKIQEAEDIDSVEVEHEASNTVLDKRYIWVFAVLNEHGEYVDENIPYIQDAIDILLDNDATFLIAFPYVDPKPEDETVGLVFADTPGPVVLYNREEARLSKDKLKKDKSDPEPSELDLAMSDQEEKEQELAQESTIKEGANSFRFTDEEFNVLQKISSRTKMDTWFELVDGEEEDYVYDLESQKVLPMEEAIAELQEGLSNYSHADLTEEEKRVFDGILDYFSIPNTLEESTISEGSRNDDVPHCPSCDSTNLKAKEIGSDYYCSDCSYFFNEDEAIYGLEDTKECPQCGTRVNGNPDVCPYNGCKYPMGSKTESEGQETTIRITFSEDSFKEDDSMASMFEGDFEQFAVGVTEASSELAEIKEDLGWKYDEGSVESISLPYAEAVEISNRLKRDFQVEAKIELSNAQKQEDEDGYCVSINFKESFYESVGEDTDVMDVYKEYLREVKKSLKKSETFKVSLYYEGSTEVDFYTNVLTKEQAERVAKHFNDKAEVEIKKVEV